jgi:hypothetical protein
MYYFIILFELLFYMYMLHFYLGWVPKRNLIGHVDKVYILDFFGSESLQHANKDFQISPRNILTAFGSPWNMFLGYKISDSRLARYANIPKKQQGVIWGKDPKHYRSSINMLRAIADKVQLHSTSSSAVFNHPNIIWHGHQSHESWLKLLAESKFLIGLGDPLLGPSAIDALSMGCMYINPIYKVAVRKIHTSQHDYAMNNIDSKRVCSFQLSDVQEALECVNRALESTLDLYIPPDFTNTSYMERVHNIFKK